MAGCTVSIEEWQMLDLAGPVIGIDEAGRGAWAGPLIVAAAAFPVKLAPDRLDDIRDSKRLSPQRRQEVGEWLRRNCSYGIGRVESWEIDQVGISKAAALAALKALVFLLWDLRRPPAAIMLDGGPSCWGDLENRLPTITPAPWYYMVKGDDLVKEVSAASIIAKTQRDTIMLAADRALPGWEFGRHFGYGTAVHQAALAAQGLSPIHRRSYLPIRKIATAQERMVWGENRWH